LAATVFPFSSEVAFLLALENGMPKLTALFVASCGNILAIIVNYFFGYWLYEKTHTKLSSKKIGRKSLELGNKYALWSLLLSWLPIIGDPLTLVAGLLRVNFFAFVLIAGGLRIARYYFLTFVVQ